MAVCVSPVLPESPTGVDLLVFVEVFVCVRSCQPHPYFVCMCVCSCVCVCLGERQKVCVWGGGGRVKRGFTCKAAAVKSSLQEWPLVLNGI